MKRRIAVLLTIALLLSYFPDNNVINTYVIAPTPIPLEIEYDKHIMITVRKAGIADVTSSILIFP